MTKSLYLLDGTITLVLVVRGRGSLFSARWFGLVGAGTAACTLAMGGVIASSGVAVGWVVWSFGAAFFVRQKFALLLIWCRLVCWSHMFTIPSVGLPIGYHKV